MKKKIIIPIYSSYPYSIGGREYWISGICDKMVKDGYDICIYALSPPVNDLDRPRVDIKSELNRQARHCSSSPCRIIYINTPRSFTNKSRYLKKIMSTYGVSNLLLLDFWIFSFFVKNHILAEYDENTDELVFIVPNPGLECLPALKIKKSHPSTKTVIIISGEWLKDTAVSFPSFVDILKKVEYDTVHSADLVIYPNQRQYAADQQRLGLKKDKTVVFPFVYYDDKLFLPPTVEYKEQMREKYGAKSGKLIAINVATVRYIKGHDILIKAMNSLSEELRSKIELWIVGRGDASILSELKSMVREKTNVRFLGLRNRNEVADLMKAADFFILPSRSEGMPTVLLEASAIGLPIISTDVGSVREMMDGSGIIVKPEDADSLRQGIIEIVENLDYHKQKAMEQAQKIRNKHSIDAVYTKLMGIINEHLFSRETKDSMEKREP